METETSNLFQAIGAGATALTFLAGLVVYKADSNQKRNDLLAEQAILSLARAWEVFTENGTAPRPKSNRVTWLTTARHLERYKRLRSAMRRPGAHDVVLNEHEEYWRYRFYCFIDTIAMENGFYSRELSSGEKIEPRSAYVIVKFAGWGDEEDPIDHVTFSESDLSDFMFKRHRLLGSYLRTYLQRSQGKGQQPAKSPRT
ncbi:hypothetical protein ABE485_13730 [Achromobacter spanius]|uniref:hypothetical protein n=1 Tax=Achromobacter spanius TaxID=217203 RepID=UPI003209CF87